MSGADESGRPLFDIDGPESTEIPYLALRLIRNSRGGLAADRARVIDSRDLRDGVVERLRTAYQAATELIGDLKSDPELVWRFEPLIEDTSRIAR